MPSERRKNRNKQPLTLLSIGIPSRQAWPTHVGGAACSSQFFTDDSIAVLEYTVAVALRTAGGAAYVRH